MATNPEELAGSFDKKGASGVNRETPLTDILADQVNNVIGQLHDDVWLKDLFKWKKNPQTPGEWREFMESLASDRKIAQESAIKGVIGATVRSNESDSPLEWMRKRALGGQHPLIQSIYNLGEARALNEEDWEGRYGFGALRARFVVRALKKKDSEEN